jgi:hypothetical protein
VSPFQLGAALALLAGALAAVSARDRRWILGGLVVCLGFAGVVADPLPPPLAIAIRLVAALLGVSLVELAVRESPGPTQGAPLGPLTTALAAGAAAVVGYAASGVGSPAAGPALATAAGLGLATIAVGPLVLGRDVVRVGTSMVLLVTGVALVRAGLAGTPGPLEQVVIALVSLAILGATAAISAGALRAGHDLALTGGVLRETLFEAHPLAAANRGAADPVPRRRLAGRGPAAQPRRDAAAHQLTLEERLRLTVPVESRAEAVEEPPPDAAPAPTAAPTDPADAPPPE